MHINLAEERYSKVEKYSGNIQQKFSGWAIFAQG